VQVFALERYSFNIYVGQDAVEPLWHPPSGLAK
jgi:hypothetical protein